MAPPSRRRDWSTSTSSTWLSPLCPTRHNPGSHFSARWGGSTLERADRPPSPPTRSNAELLAEIQRTFPQVVAESSHGRIEARGCGQDGIVGAVSVLVSDQAIYTVFNSAEHNGDRTRRIALDEAFTNYWRAHDGIRCRIYAIARDRHALVEDGVNAGHPPSLVFQVNSRHEEEVLLILSDEETKQLTDALGRLYRKLAQ